MGNEVPTFRRLGNLVLFNQFGPKLDFRNETHNEEYFRWLDEMKRDIGKLVPAASIKEKPNDRSDPRRNTGVYYDTPDYQLLHGHMVLRTTSNPKTHAFCAFKYGADEHQVRRDHRYIFDGDEKHAIQHGPVSESSVRIVRHLLSRTDIGNPGTYLRESTGITSRELTPALLLVQHRFTFYVLLDDRDALRCSLDRAEVSNLRQPPETRDAGNFSEIELPIYPRIAPEVLSDPRVKALMDALSDSLVARFDVGPVHDSKYRRAARLLGLFETQG